MDHSASEFRVLSVANGSPDYDKQVAAMLLKVFPRLRQVSALFGLDSARLRLRLRLIGQGG